MTKQKTLILKGRIYEILGNYEEAEKNYQDAYDSSGTSRDLERLSAIIQKRSNLEDINLDESGFSGIDLNELRDKKRRYISRDVKIEKFEDFFKFFDDDSRVGR